MDPRSSRSLAVMRSPSAQSTVLATALAVLAAATVTASGLSRTTAPVAAPVTIRSFAGGWAGHDRGLIITPQGVGREQVNSGCCPPFFKMTFVLSYPRGTARDARATLTVTAVHAPPRGGYAVKYPYPHVGQKATLRLQAGVIWEPLTGTDYCSGPAENAGKCGA